jgi:hypothetical protein
MNISQCLAYKFTLLAAAFVASFPLAPVAIAEPATFWLTNNTDVVITRLDVETIRGDDWGTIAQGSFEPGETVEVFINDARADCSYHFRVYYQDDGIKMRDYYNVNVCDQPYWSLP